MTAADGVRWGIIGTATIAHVQFLPGLREAGGVAAAVAGRDADRAERFARDHGVARSIAGYQNLIEDPETDALYLALPNSLHAEWAIRALRAGKPLLCEKPLTGSLAETEQVLAVASETGTPLWEAFVFPFHAQMAQLTSLLGRGAIGELREIQSSFHFPLADRSADIRMSADLAGGALNDVGCYPIRLACGLLGAEHESAWAAAEWAGGVDVETWGALGFPGGRRLLLSCGFNRARDTFTRLVGTGGQINVTNPFHPGPQDAYEVRSPGKATEAWPALGADQRSFTPAIRHVQAVVRGQEAPRLLAAETSLGPARARHDLARSAGAPPARPA